jgi:alpha-L-arabinofuranosidase
LIGYDALHSFGSPSYYALAVFGQNKGDVVLPAKLGIPPVGETLDPSPHGAVGVGCYRTQTEYQDMVVTGPDGQKLGDGSLTGDPAKWQYFHGQWTSADGTMKPQTVATTWAITGDKSWQDYTISLRARKLGGEEGFIVIWHARDGENYRWWNIGGWGNTQMCCEEAEDGDRQGFGPGSPFTVETGRWYDLRLEVKGHHVRGYIDGKLVLEAADAPRAAPASAYASAQYVNASREVIVKVVNAGADPLETGIRLQGAGRVGPRGKAIVLTGEPSAINTVEQPTNVAPKEEILDNVAASFKRTFPPHSLTLLRFPAGRQN